LFEALRQRRHYGTTGARIFVDMHASFDQPVVGFSDDPQLGPVEIGGYKFKFTIQNPPPKFLEAECHKNMMFTLKQAAMSPAIEITGVSVSSLGDGLYTIVATVENTGFLPTNISEQAKVMRVARPVTATLTCGEGVTVLGEARQSLDHIEGRSSTVASLFGAIAAPSVKQATFTVRAAKGTAAPEVTVKISSEKAGQAEKKVTLTAQ